MSVFDAPAPQPPRHECPYCGVDLEKASHRLDCRVVRDIEGIEGWLDAPAFLIRKRHNAFD